MSEDHEIAEQVLRARARIRGEDLVAWKPVIGFPGLLYGYRVNGAGGPMVGGACFIVNIRARAVYKCSPAVPVHLLAEKIKAGRLAPM